MSPTSAPDDLGPDGRGLYAAVGAWLDAEGFDLDPHEAPQVAELARTVDRLAACRTALDALDVGSPAWVRVVAEERQQRLAYGRQVSSLGFPSGVVADTPTTKGTTPRSRRAQKAAAARWGTAG